MTRRDRSYIPLSAHSSALLQGLREAGIEGLPEERMAELGGRYWRQALGRLCRWHPVGEMNGRFVLVEVEGSRRGVVDEAGDALGPNTPVTPAAALSPDPQLQLDVPLGGHYDLDRAA